MEGQIIAKCGLHCSECRAFLATQNNDIESLKLLAKEWYGKEADSGACVCDGCTALGRKNQHCNNCEIRNCAVNRGVVNCAHCIDYGCETISAFLEFSPAAKLNLETIQASL